MKKIRVLLVEDHKIVREGLKLLLESEGDIEIISEGRNGREAVELQQKLLPDVTVMDIGMPLLNGLQAAQQILKNGPKSPILMLSAHDDPEYVEEVISLGAAGYLVKHCGGAILAQAIREISRGKTYYGPSVTKQLRDQYLMPSGSRGLVKNIKNRLTTREAEHLQLIAEGFVNKQIAAELKISIKTVEKHRQNLMEKLNIHEIAGLTRFAMAAGIIECSGQQTVARSRRRSSESITKARME